MPEPIAANTEEDRAAILREFQSVSDQCPTAAAARVTDDSPHPDALWLPMSRLFVALPPGSPLCWADAPDGIVRHGLPPGGVLYVPGHSWERVDPAKPRRHLAIVLHNETVRFLLIEHDGNPDATPARRCYHTSAPASSTVHELLASVEDTACAIERRAFLPAAVHLLMRQLAADIPHDIGLSEHLYRAVCSYIVDHVNQPLDRAGVAACFQRHPNHLSRLFRTHGDCTFQQFLTRARLERAREMLLHTNQPIKKICTACGYERQSHFGARFREFTGVSPAVYRSQALEKQHD